ncbi:MAG: methyl-accepting chemotaxis protein [Myxococcota bacterium]|jgi:methyl-accepting chemotaxis protein
MNERRGRIRRALFELRTSVGSDHHSPADSIRLIDENLDELFAVTRDAAARESRGDVDHIGEIERLRSQLEECRVEARRRYKNASADAVAARDLAINAERQMAEARTLRDSTVGEIERLREEALVARSEREQSKILADRLDEEVTTLRDSADALTERARALRGRSGADRERLSEALREAERLERQTSELETTNRRLQASLEQERDQRRAQQTEVKQAAVCAQQLAREIGQANSQRSQLGF